MISVPHKLVRYKMGVIESPTHIVLDGMFVTVCGMAPPTYSETVEQSKGSEVTCRECKSQFNIKKLGFRMAQDYKEWSIQRVVG